MVVVATSHHEVSVNEHGAGQILSTCLLRCHQQVCVTMSSWQAASVCWPRNSSSVQRTGWPAQLHQRRAHGDRPWRITDMRKPRIARSATKTSSRPPKVLQQMRVATYDSSSMRDFFPRAAMAWMTCDGRPGQGSFVTTTGSKRETSYFQASSVRRLR